MVVASSQSLTKVKPPITKGDPIVPFQESIRRTAVDMDRRSEEELMTEVREQSDPAAREQALFELLHRDSEAAFPLVADALQNDSNRDLRINLMWALEGIDAPSSRELRELIVSRINDADSHVREWARVFAWEKGWIAEDFRTATKANYYEGRTFDQTIFLRIDCHLYIRLADSNDVWGHVRLSPQMLARVYGQALACPCVANREKQIVISKTLSGLYEDGSDHYESFLFKGFTERTSPSEGNFYFEANANRPFYRSGRASDLSEGVIPNVTVPFAREGQWFLNDNICIEDKYAIEYVRGLFQGWAFVNIERIEQTDGQFLFPGNSVLSTLHHPEIGDLTNAFFTGSFKGKVLDWSGDGVLDLNYLPSYATRDGEIDSDLDGVPDAPGRTMTPPKPLTF